MTDKSTHASDCDWHVDQYPWECTCGLIARKKAMDELIALSAYELGYTTTLQIRTASPRLH
jgi:hypothetical protein